MPKNFEIKISSILGGISPNLFQGRSDQFHASIGIDPDWPTNDGSLVRTSGVLRPSAYQDFTGAGLTGYPVWFMVPSTSASLYAYASDGKLMEYGSTLTSASELSFGIPSGGNGSGGAFYNNYIYLGTSSSVARFGPLDAAGPVFNNDWWGNEALGPALGDAGYPVNRGITLPNKPMHVHNDGALYFATYDIASAVSSTRGMGLVHKIKTQYDGAIEGGSNNGSTYNVLDLPPGHMPTDIESFGTDLVIATIPTGSDVTFSHGKAKLFFWDTLSQDYYRVVELPDPVCTALLNANGNLYVWSGNMNNGSRISVYAGGFSVKQIAFFEEGFSPPAGAVDGLGNRIAWGAFTTYPENTASVYSLGYKDARLPASLHNIINTSAAASAGSGMVSALKAIQQASFIAPRFVVGWLDAADYGIDKAGSTYRTSSWRSLQYEVGESFKITEITLSLGAAVAANMTLTPTIYVDDAGTLTNLAVINTANFAGGEQRIVYKDQSIEGKNNFFLQLRWTGSALLPVDLPIIIKGETIDNATR